MKKEYSIQINVNLETNETKIGSSSKDPWTDMAICLEGLGVICKMCLDKGMSEDKVYGEVYNYFGKLAKTYKIKHELN